MNKNILLLTLMILMLCSSVFATTIISPDNNSIVDINGFDINYTLTGSERTLSFIDKNDTLLWVSFDDLSMTSETTMTSDSWVADRINGFNLSMRGVPSYDINKSTAFYGQGIDYKWENITADARNTFELLSTDPANSDFFDYVNDYNNTYTLCVLAKPNPTTYLASDNQGVGYAGFGTTSSSSYQGIIRSHINKDLPQSDADVRFVFVDSVGTLVNTGSGTPDISYDKWELSCAQRSFDESYPTKATIHLRTLRDDGLYSPSPNTQGVTLANVGADINAFRIGNVGGISGLYSAPSFNGIIDEVFVFKREISDAEMALLFNTTTSNAIHTPSVDSFVENESETFNIYTQTDTGIFDVDALTVTPQTPPPEPIPPSIINITSPANNSIVNYTGFDFVYDINDSDVVTQLSFIDDGSLMFWTTFDDGEVDPITGSSTLTDKVNGYELTLTGTSPENNISLVDGRFGGASYWNFSQPDLTYRYEMTNNAQNSALFDYVNDYQNTFTICAIAKPENYLFANHGQNGVGFAGFGTTASSSQQQGIGMEWDSGNADAGAQFYILDTVISLVNAGRTTTQDVPFDEWSIFCGVRKPYNETHFYHYPMAIGEIAEFAGQEPTLYSDSFTGGYIPIANMGYTLDALRVGTKGAVGGSIAPGVMSGTLDEVFIFSRELSVPEMTKLFQSNKGPQTVPFTPGFELFGTEVTYEIYAKDSTGYTSVDSVTLQVSEDPLRVAFDEGDLTTLPYVSDTDPRTTTITTKNLDAYSFFTLNQEDILMWVDFEDETVAPDSSWVVDKINGYNFTKVGTVQENITLNNESLWGQGLDFNYPANPDISEHYILQDTAETAELFNYINNLENDWTMCTNAYSESFTEPTPHGQYGQGYIGFGTSRSTSSGYGLGKGGAVSGTDRYSFHYLSTNSGLINQDTRTTSSFASNSWDVICGQQKNYNTTHIALTIHAATQSGTYENFTTYIDKLNPASGALEVWDNLKLGSQGMPGGSIAPGGLNGFLDDTFILGKAMTETEVRALATNNTATLSVDISDDLVLGNNNYTVYGGASTGDTSIVTYDIMYTGSEFIDMLYPYKTDTVNTQKNSCVVYQRDTVDSGSGRVVMNISAGITGLEYSFNNGPWTAATEVDENGLTVFNFTGDVGWGDLKVRAENIPEMEATKSNVGIGETFVASGQSNGVVLPATSSVPTDGTTLHCIWQGPTTCTSYTNGYWAVNNNPNTPETSSRDYSKYSIYRLAQETGIPMGTVGASQCGTGILGWQNQAKRDNYEYNVGLATNGTNKIKWHLHAGSTSDSASSSFDIGAIDDHQSWINSVHSLPVQTIYQIPNFQGNNKTNINKARYYLDMYHETNENVHQGPAFGDIKMHWRDTYVDLHFTDAEQKGQYSYRWYRAISDALLGTDLYTQPTIQSISKDTSLNMLKITFDKPIHTAIWKDPNTKVVNKPEGWKISVGDNHYYDVNIIEYNIDGNDLYLTLNESLDGSISITYPYGAKPWYNYDDMTQPYDDKVMIYSTSGELAEQIWVYDTVSTFQFVATPLLTSANNVKFIVFSAFGLLSVIIIAAAGLMIVNIFNQDGFDISELTNVSLMAIGLGIVLIVGYVIITLVSNGLYG